MQSLHAATEAYKVAIDTALAAFTVAYGEAESDLATIKEQSAAIQAETAKHRDALDKLAEIRRKLDAGLLG